MHKMQKKYLFIITALIIGDVIGCDNKMKCFNRSNSDLSETKDFSDRNGENPGEINDKFKETISKDVEKMVAQVSDYIYDAKFRDNDRSNLNISEKQIDFIASEDVDRILDSVSDYLKNITTDIKETKTLMKEFNKTKIFVKTFELVDKSATEKIDSEIITEIIPLTTESSPEVTFTTETATRTTELSNDIELYNIIDQTTDDATTAVTEKIKHINIFDDYLVSDDFDDENSTDYPIIDYVELYKDTVNEYVEYKPTVLPIDDLKEKIQRGEKAIETEFEKALNFKMDDDLNRLIQNITSLTVETCSGGNTIVTSGVFPWVATIFVMNETNHQFDYFCDGALLSDRVVLTAGRCVKPANKTFSEIDLIVILGKTSLQISGGNENIMRVKNIVLHENFSNGPDGVENDLAALILEDNITLNDDIAAACFDDNDVSVDNTDSMTTAWSLSGDLTLIYFDKEKSKACVECNKVENTFCATYGDDVALCPSYGGLFISRATDSRISLRGIFNGDPLDRGICRNKTVLYTALSNYREWINNVINKNKL